MGRGIALTFALAGCQVSLIDVKQRAPVPVCSRVW
jgi:3-hydroxyacyl-CoA dehydrogenase